MSTAPLNTMFMRIAKRAESADPDRLRRTFVAIDPLVTMLELPEHQVLYGRRGTGKTHILKYLAETVRDEGQLAGYFDLRNIGSSGSLYADAREPVSRRATHLLIDVVEALHNALWEAILDLDLDDRLEPLAVAMDRLAEAATEVRIIGEVEDEGVVATTDEKSSGLTAGVNGGARPSVTADRRRHRQSQRSRRVVRRGEQRHHVLFGSLAAALDDVMQAIRPRQLWVLLDEWSALPFDLQPFLADLLRRTLFPISGITVKIGAIERRSRFELTTERGEYTGIELDADTSASLDLDDFLVFGNKRAHSVSFFGELLYRHVHVLMRDKGFELGIPNAGEFLSAAFATPGAFCELVLASEGVPRDAINIAGLAAAVAGRNKISREDVSTAARDYFLRDKEGRIPPKAEAALANLVRRCAEQKTRVLYLRRHGESDDPVIQQLYDARLIHRVRQGIVDVGDPSVKHDVYLVDYGCFVDLMTGGRLRGVDDGLARELRLVGDKDVQVDARSYAMLPRAWYRRS